MIHIITNKPRVTSLRPRDTADDPFYYTFKVQCTSCREIHPNYITMSRFETNEVSGSRGEANFVWRCKNCKVILGPNLTLKGDSGLIVMTEGTLSELQGQIRPEAL